MSFWGPLAAVLVLAACPIAAEDVVVLDHAVPNRLAVAELAGAPELRFAGVIPAGNDAHADPGFLRQRGLWLEPAGTTTLAATLVPQSGGSPLVGVTGPGIVEFAGTWVADTGSVIPWLVLDAGATFRVLPEATFRFIKEGFYTLQLWVNGDGSGVLDLGSAFVADRTAAGTVRAGLGSIRMGAGTLVSRSSASLPLGYRPLPGGGAQANGHLAFEAGGPLRWIVDGEDQRYPGAIWLWRDVTVETRFDLVHDGVRESAPDYVAENGLTTHRPVTLTKRGPARLVLAGAQRHAAGARLRVEEGTLEVLTPTEAGDGSPPRVEVVPGARLAWQGGGRVASLALAGELDLAGPIATPAGGEVVLASTATVRWAPWATGTAAIAAGGPLVLAGRLVVDAVPGEVRTAGDRLVFATGASVTGLPELEDRTGLGLRWETTASSVALVATRSTPALPGAVLVEDSFDAESPAWKDLSTVPLWGSPRARRSAFERAGGVLRLVRSGPGDTTSWTEYADPAGLKTFTAVDARFPSAVPLGTTQVTVDFRARWQATTTGSGESGRFIVALNHGYPEGGLDLTPEGSPGSRLADFSAAWWARPAYHVRLRNSTTRAGDSFLQYGGGKTALGEYESTDAWWLPGFISGAGGIAPGNGADFPANSWVRTNEGLARTTFATFRFRVLPDRQELWRDDDDDGELEPSELKAVMPLPVESTAPFYRRQPTVEGLRVYWSGGDAGVPGSGQVELDWIRTVAQPDLDPVASAGEDVAVRAGSSGLGVVRLDGGGSADPEGRPLRWFWTVDGVLARVASGPRATLLLAPGVHVVDLWVLDEAGNVARDSLVATVAAGNVRPTARAGADLQVTATNGWYGVVRLDGSASSDPDGGIARARWTTAGGTRVIADGAALALDAAFGVGTHRVELATWDAEGAVATDELRVDVLSPVAPGPASLVYRENFSRVADGTERGVKDVGWKLMRFDGAPVAEIGADGNAHRSLASTTTAVPWLPRVASNPGGLEHEVAGAVGHVWMNQMPFRNASPGEWMLWTDEVAFDRAAVELASLRFHASDGSPERVAHAPAVRIAGTWYLGRDLAIETQGTTWRAYEIPLSESGWYRFDASPTFSVARAEPVGRLPAGGVEAFGIYFVKEYAWYNSNLDNLEVWVRPRTPVSGYGRWLADTVGHVELAARHASGAWLPAADADGDGLPNALERALGFRPDAAVEPRGIPAALEIPEPGRLRVRLAVAAGFPAASIRPQASVDLRGWVDPLSAPLAAPAGDGESIVLEWSFALPPAGGAFVRWTVD